MRMEHVSTLCAVSTVGIAATGFALGRVEQKSPPSSRLRNKIHPQGGCAPAATDAATFPPLDTSRPRTRHTSVAVDLASPTDTGPRVHDDVVGLGCSDEPSRPKSSFGGIRLRRRGQTFSTTLSPAPKDDLPVLHDRRPSSSWVRRLSFQPDKRPSCQSPVFPSSDGPASPVYSRPSSQRRPPNKLVKRPTLQHNINPLFESAPSSPLTPTFHRPATSYQRSGHLGHKATHSLNFEPSSFADPRVQSTTDGAPQTVDSWRPYLRTSLGGSLDRLTRRFSTNTKPRDSGLRRILPSSDTAPALLLGTSVASKEISNTVDPEWRALGSPVHFRNPFQQSASAQREEPESPCVPSHNERGPLHSHDEADLQCEDNSPEAVGGGGGAGDFALDRPKCRAASTPLPNQAKLEGANVASSIQERRNVSHPAGVRARTPTVSETGDPFSLDLDVIGARRKFVPSYSQPDIGNLRESRQRPMTSDSAIPSTHQGSMRHRPKRHSIAASEPTSTVIGSDDTHVFTSSEEDDTDFLSDTAFDSIRTHVTSSSSGLHTARIESIFDKSIPLGIAEDASTPLGNPDSCDFFAPQQREKSHFDKDADKVPALVSTRPAPDEINMSEGNSGISFISDLTDDEDTHSLIAALPGDTMGQALPPKGPPLSLTTHNLNRGKAKPSLPDKEQETPVEMQGHAQYGLPGVTNGAPGTTPRMNIFDWSEQPKPDREACGPDWRPRTVHGKHGPELRGSRAPSRKVPNALHLRSQSVPVSRDIATAQDSRRTSGKYGTWGLGSKGVSEDWDSDFDFDESDENNTNDNTRPRKNLSESVMVVPQAIMERQASLHGQFGQVQELTLLVEELKRLRQRASFLGIVQGPSSELWKEAEGIVDLATLDDEEDHLSPPGSPASLTFSFDDSEGEKSTTNGLWKRSSGVSWGAALSEQPHRISSEFPIPDHKENSVLDMIYQQRVSHEPASNGSHLTPPKKLPFDTQSLHSLVNRAGVVTRALKEVIRKADEVPSGPHDVHTSAPPFSQIFNRPSNDSLSCFDSLVG
ncbi:hypothetical protein P168DRAFT_328869 [Aspergillus campestris IBT 28561]|uniref:Uncharacterized protein n=1 Tax=Aspergillus campestris (strain IBT 28561) TaxID=1392248 RepID=A0A2I1CW63_ASPC2|nr:uncharacterized protein P168DRAFT_328869 [Aspergillus campestris IBT 28561]PKY01862.1 hypothetical protein P168DRAFT_328869 [Aspergillus campestris IBT 28561]